MTDLRPTSPVLQEDEFYCFENVTFQVEDTFFRVPKNGFLTSGSFLATLFQLPVVHSQARQNDAERQVEGASKENPIKVPAGVSKTAFRNLLRVMYPFQGSGGLPSQIDEWVEVLHLATMWDLTKIREQAILAITPLVKNEPSGVRRVLLGKQFEVESWVEEGYRTLVCRDWTHGLKYEELVSAGMDPLDVCRLYSAREKIWCRYLTNNGGCPGLQPELRAIDLVKEIFADELRHIRRAQEPM